MSLERAYKNCRICYCIGSKIGSLDDANEATMAPMNEAMKAL